MAINKAVDKYELTFEDEQSISIWKYDKEKFKNGPVSVEYRWKAKYLKELELLKASDALKKAEAKKLKVKNIKQKV